MKLQLIEFVLNRVCKDIKDKNIWMILRRCQLIVCSQTDVMRRIMW